VTRGTDGAGAITLAHAYLRQFPAEAAPHVETAALDDAARLLANEEAGHVAAVLERIDARRVAELLGVLPPERRSGVLAVMDPVRAAAALAWLDREHRQAMLQGLDGATARELETVAEYPPETAGRLMDPRAITVRRDTPAEDALSRLRGVGQRHVSDLFVTDEDGRLAGRVPVQDLATAPPGEPVGALMLPPMSVADTDTAQEVVALLTDRRLATLPVVDFERRLVGVIRHDTLVRTAQQDVAADIQAMVGASRQERALSPAVFAVRARLPWLEINLATAFLAAAVVGLFESTIAQFTALAVLLPVVAGQSGNTGAQALAVTMRGLALREVRVSQWGLVARKELIVAAVNGVAVALTTAAGVFVWSRSTGLSMVIGVSMVLSMTAAGLAGVIIPMVLTRLGQDPAQSSSIVLTTVTDVVGFASFLGIATVLSGTL
jgi:magnesium transporter